VVACADYSRFLIRQRD